MGLLLYQFLGLLHSSQRQAVKRTIELVDNTISIRNNTTYSKTLAVSTHAKKKGTPMKLPKKSKSAGFTLVELLIVIIIIGILAAIAFVAYSGSQNKAKKADAEATLSQSRSKLAEYNSDNGKYPESKATFTTWLASASGGNNDSIATKLGGSGYTYTPGPSGCDNSTGGDCTDYSLTAAGSMFSGTDITVTN